MTAPCGCGASGTATSSPPLWARPDVRAVLGETLRPGGFALTDTAVETLGLRPGMAVLDAGCGPGGSVRRLRRRHGLRALGADLRPGPAPGLPLCCADVAALPVKDHCLDALFCECVLSLQPDPAETLAEFFRVLRPGGGLALSDLYRGEGDSPPSQTSSRLKGQGMPRHCAEGALPRALLLELLGGAGFQLLCFQDHSPLLRDLAARLAWAGCDAPACDAGGTAGYFLLLARKPEENHA